MKSTLKYIFISLSVLAVLVYLGYSLWFFADRGQNKVCTHFEIVLTDFDKIQLLSQRDVAVLLDRANLNPMGKSIKNINTEQIEDEILKNEMIKTVECFKSPSGSVKVTISQRCPKFRVVGFDSYYIDTDRKPMPVSTNYAAYVPVVSGRVTKTFAVGKLYDFINYLEEHPFWNAQIEQINIRDDLKVELVPRVGDAIVLLGKLDNFEPRLEKLRKLYEKGFNVIGWNRYKHIDLQFKDQVVCSKKDEVEEEEPTLPANNDVTKDSISAKII